MIMKTENLKMEGSEDFWMRQIESVTTGIGIKFKLTNTKYFFFRIGWQSLDQEEDNTEDSTL